MENCGLHNTLSGRRCHILLLLQSSLSSILLLTLVQHLVKHSRREKECGTAAGGRTDGRARADLRKCDINCRMKS